jgi:peptidoglycan hydrolase CwlO-like protein
MPPTVKSLEERIDDLAGDVSDLKSQMAHVLAKLEIFGTTLTAIQGQLQTIATQLASTMTSLATTTARLDAVSVKLDTYTSDYAAFRSKSDTTFALVRWVGVFAAGVFLTIVISAFNVSRSAGNLEATVQQQQKVLDEIRRELTDLRAKPKSPLP